MYRFPGMNTGEFRTKIHVTTAYMDFNGVRYGF